MKNKDELTEINRYCSPYSLLVLTPKKLVRLYCPFKVKAMYNSNGINKGEEYQVGKVQIQTNRKIIYIINGSAYIYSLFRIII